VQSSENGFLKILRSTGSLAAWSVVWSLECSLLTQCNLFFFQFCFQTDQAVENAIKLDGSEFKGRKLKVTHKRVNQPGMTQAAGPSGRGGGGRGGGGFGGRFGGRGGYRGGYRGGGRGFGRGRGGGGRGAAGYHPYY
jgi:hypothetical protein